MAENARPATTAPADELVQIVDRDNRPIGAEPRRVMRARGLIHRASYILVFNSEGKLYIQKRTMTKDIYPGYWDVAAGGVMLAGETDRLSAERELAEELGVSAADGLEFLCHHYYEAGDNKVWGAVFCCRHDGPFTHQVEEVAYGEFASLEEIRYRSTTEPFTPDGIEIIERLVEEGKIPPQN